MSFFPFHLKLRNFSPVSKFPQLFFQTFPLDTSSITESILFLILVKSKVWLLANRGAKSLKMLSISCNPAFLPLGKISKLPYLSTIKSTLIFKMSFLRSWFCHTSYDLPHVPSFASLLLKSSDRKIRQCLLSWKSESAKYHQVVSNFSPVTYFSSQKTEYCCFLHSYTKQNSQKI